MRVMKAGIDVAACESYCRFDEIELLCHSRSHTYLASTSSL